MNSDSSWPKSQKQRPIRPSMERKRAATGHSPALPPVLFELPNLAGERTLGRIDTPQTESNAVPESKAPTTTPPVQQPATESYPRVSAPERSTDAVLARWGSRGMVIGLLFVLFGAAIFFIKQNDRKTKSTQSAQTTDQTDSSTTALTAKTEAPASGSLELVVDPLLTPTTPETNNAEPVVEVSVAADISNSSDSGSEPAEAFAGLNAPGQTSFPSQDQSESTKQVAKSDFPLAVETEAEQASPDIESETKASVSLDSPMLDTDPQALADLEPPALEPLQALADASKSDVAAAAEEASESVEVISALPESPLGESEIVTPGVSDLPDLSEAATTPPDASPEPQEVMSKATSTPLSTNPISAEIETAPHSAPEPFSAGGSPFQFSDTPMGVADWTRYLPVPISQPNVPTTQPGLPYTP